MNIPKAYQIQPSDAIEILLDVPLTYLSSSYFDLIFIPATVQVICAWGQRSFSYPITKDYNDDISKCIPNIRVFVLSVSETVVPSISIEHGDEEREDERTRRSHLEDVVSTQVRFFAVEDVGIPGNRFELLRGPVVTKAWIAAPESFTRGLLRYKVVKIGSAETTTSTTSTTYDPTESIAPEAISELTITLIAAIVPTGLLLLIVVIVLVNRRHAANKIKTTAKKWQDQWKQTLNLSQDQMSSPVIATSLYRYPDDTINTLGGFGLSTMPSEVQTPYLDIRQHPYAHPEMHTPYGHPQLTPFGNTGYHQDTDGYLLHMENSLMQMGGMPTEEWGMVNTALEQRQSSKPLPLPSQSKRLVSHRSTATNEGTPVEAWSTHRARDTPVVLLDHGQGDGTARWNDNPAPIENVLSNHNTDGIPQWKDDSGKLSTPKHESQLDHRPLSERRRGPGGQDQLGIRHY